jgi:hypothetical protein
MTRQRAAPPPAGSFREPAEIPEAYLLPYNSVPSLVTFQRKSRLITSLSTRASSKLDLRHPATPIAPASMWGLFKRVLCGVPACSAAPQTLTPLPQATTAKRGLAARAAATEGDDVGPRSSDGSQHDQAAPQPVGCSKSSDSNGGFGSPVAGLPASSPVGRSGSGAAQLPLTPMSQGTTVAPPRQPPGSDSAALESLLPTPATAKSLPAAVTPASTTSDCRTPDQRPVGGAPATHGASAVAAPRSGASSCMSSGFLMEGGKPVGIANSTSKHHPSKPLEPHVSAQEQATVPCRRPGAVLCRTRRAWRTAGDRMLLGRGHSGN